MTRPMSVRTTVVAVAASALLIAACGGDDDAGEGSTEAFCELVAEPVSPDASDDDVAAQIEALTAAAPSEIADEMETLSDLFTSLQGIDLETASEDDLAAFDTALAEFQPLSAELEAWTVDNCPGIDEGVFSTTG